MKGIKVHFSGRVQGVGFRYTTLQISNQFDVTGTVENLSDGRVRLIAEGSSDQVDGFLAEIKHRLSSNIVDVEIDRQDFTGEFEQFTIRR